MEPTQRLLFGHFPREIGVPRRFTAFSERHFDDIVERLGANGLNAYASLARFDPKPRCDKVSFDLDSLAKRETGDGWSHPLIPRQADDSEVIDMMRTDPDVADAVLGGVVEDVRALATATADDGIPAVGVYTGFGVHFHQLYQEAENPRNEMLTTANKYNEECDLDTLDQVPVGDVKRIMRIPNMQRFDDGEPCPLWTVPLTHGEMLMMTVEDLIEWSTMPRELPFDASLPSRHLRPEMESHDDYLEQCGYIAPQLPVPEASDHTYSEEAEWFLEQYVPLPCIRERALTPSPDHKVRQQVAVHLFNAGCSVQRALDIIRGLNWRNFDSATTRKQLEQIWETGYADSACKTLKEQGYCVRLDDPKSCETYGWFGGNREAEWNGRGPID